MNNWPAYEAGLRKRGDVTVWFDESCADSWNAPSSGLPGGQRRYSDLAIVTTLTLRTVFHLALRQAEGFVHSLLSLMDLEIPTPDHTTLSRRSSSLKPVIDYNIASNEPVHRVVDSTGLSIHGEGPWSQYKSGNKRRRGWRKMHIAVDANGHLVATSLSKETTRDASRVPHLFDNYRGPLASLTGDRGYDQASVYRQALQRNADASIVIPDVCPNEGYGEEGAHDYHD